MRIVTKTLEGREHYVVPMVMITEGVHNGSRGPVYYPADELRRSITAWNGKPIVVYHPDMYYSMFAGHPEVFNRQKVGTVFNTRYHENRLKADAWIDVERVRKVDPRILAAIRQREVMEVSTGLSFPLTDNHGTWNNEQYHYVARNLQPDHLAILPDKKGACSIADGAGLCRNDHREAGLMLPAMIF